MKTVNHGNHHRVELHAQKDPTDIQRLNLKNVLIQSQVLFLAYASFSIEINREIPKRHAETGSTYR